MLVTAASLAFGYFGTGGRRGDATPRPPIAERVLAEGDAALEESESGVAAIAAAPDDESHEEAPADDAPISEAERRNREAVAQANDGNLKAATELLREARRLEPANDLYRTNLQAVLINAAFAHLGAARFRDAIPRFIEALALGDRGEIRRGLGYAYYRTDNPDQARTNLERDRLGRRRRGAITLGRIYLDRHDQPRAPPS
jgi:tetratricopeptide (TPR) repeat protein